MYKLSWLLLSPGEFGEVYKAHLIRRTGDREPRTVAVKTLRGLVQLIEYNNQLLAQSEATLS